MKLTDHANSLQTNSQPTVSQGFGIGDVSVIIDILRNRLYEKKKQTTVQEYICNGRDALREIGKPDSDMEVTIPTHFSPTFKVRDYGVGIAPERMMDIFIKYGASTKRGDNVQTGGLGIGGKSFFSYTDSFSINTFLNGVKRSYVAHIGTDNAGRLDLIDTQPTTERNGTEILGAVKRDDVYEFRDAVLRAVYFWENRPTLKGVTDVPDLVKGYCLGEVEIIHEDLVPDFVDGGYGKEVLGVIDGIPYVISEKLLNKCETLKKLNSFVRRKLLLKFGNGVVEVAASRESIADSPKSVAALEQIAKKAGLEIKNHIAKSFADVKTPSEYIETYRKLNEVFNVESGFAKYGSYFIQGNSLNSDLLKKVKITEIHCLGRYGRGRIAKITKKEWAEPNRKIPLELFDDVFFAHDGDSPITRNKRVKAYLENKSKFLLLEPLILNVVENVKVVDSKGVETEKATTKNINYLSEFKQVVRELGVKDFQKVAFTVIPKEQRAKITRDKIEFCMHVLDGKRHQYTTLAENTQKYLYVPLTKDKGWEGHDMSALKSIGWYLQERPERYRIVGLAERALTMVQGDKNFIPLKDWLNNYVPAAKEVNYAKYEKSENSNSIRILSKLTDAKDTRLTDMVKEYHDMASRVSDLPSMLMEKILETKEIKEFVKKDVALSLLLTSKYPLVLAYGGSCGKLEMKEMEFYVNAKFKSKEKK